MSNWTDLKTQSNISKLHTWGETVRVT